MNSRRQFLLVASLFFVPLAAAIWLYFSSGWRPGGGTEHGELIVPARPLPDAAFKGAWSLVFVEDKACAKRCRAALAEMRQVRFALNKDAARVKRVLLHAGACCESGFGAGEPDLVMLAAAGPEDAKLLALFPPAADGRRGIYIVDPHGNLMMSYPATGAASGLLKDLERLLRLSQIG